jgi:hypothetical protein
MSDGHEEIEQRALETIARLATATQTAGADQATSTTQTDIARPAPQVASATQTQQAAAASLATQTDTRDASASAAAQDRKVALITGITGQVRDKALILTTAQLINDLCRTDHTWQSCSSPRAIL